MSSYNRVTKFRILCFINKAFLQGNVPQWWDIFEICVSRFSLFVSSFLLTIAVFVIIFFNAQFNTILQGAIQGPEEFAEGLLIGVKSLLGHAVGQ